LNTKTLDIAEIDAVIFDFDGTIYDKKNYGFHVVIHNIKHPFVVLTERLVRKKLKGGDFGTRDNYYKNFFAQMHKKNKFYSEKFYEKWYFTKYQPSFRTILQKYYKADPNVEKIFNKLIDRNIKIAVNSDYPNVGERMQAIGLDNQVNNNLIHCFSSEDYGALKPATRSFLDVVRKLDCKPENCLVIGDRADTEGTAAINCGMKFIHISFKNQPNTVSWQQLSEILFPE
jgi:FMN phosphatase YigB (HAD superfamily)